MSTIDQADELMLTGSVGAVLGCSAAWVRQLSKRGALPVLAVTTDGTRLYRAADVQRLADARRAQRETGHAPKVARE